MTSVDWDGSAAHFAGAPGKVVNPDESTLSNEEIVLARAALMTMYRDSTINREVADKAWALQEKLERIQYNGGSLAVIPF